MDGDKSAQWTRLVPSRPTDGWLWPTTPVRKDGRGQIGSVDTVSSLPSDRRLTLADNTHQKRRRQIGSVDMSLYPGLVDVSISYRTDHYIYSVTANKLQAVYSAISEFCLLLKYKFTSQLLNPNVSKGRKPHPKCPFHEWPICMLLFFYAGFSLSGGMDLRFMYHL